MHYTLSSTIKKMEFKMAFKLQMNMTGTREHW